MVFNFNENTARYLEKEEKIKQPETYTHYDGNDFAYQNNEYNMLREQYRLGNIPKLNKEEMELLVFCHNTDMKKFLREEFDRNPINSAEADGGILGTCIF